MFAVAIDGPSGAGKSSISKAVAEKLGFLYVDTGALYRATALGLLEKEVPLDDIEKVTDALKTIKVDICHDSTGQRVLLDGKDVTKDIRSQDVSRSASLASAIPAVREFLLDLQIEIASKNNIIMDGRDIGTVVLPNAQVKIFLTASPQERARRRLGQMKSSGMKAEYSTVLRDINERDDRDVNRELAPLKPAEDAVMVDSTKNQKYQTVAIIVEIIQKKLDEQDKA